MKITDRCAMQEEETIFISDFSPLKSAAHDIIDDAGSIGADYICVAYNPGKVVRVDSAALAYSIKQKTGTDVIFNVATRDMNKLAMQSHLLGAQMLGLDNVLVVQGDKFNEKDLSRVKDVSDFKPTELMQSIDQMNQGLDFKGLKLKDATDLCIGASVDLGRGIQKEAVLATKKGAAGAHFFLTQPVFDMETVNAFLEAYETAAGSPLAQPVFFGLQILRPDGIIFSSVPQGVRDDLEKGRDGVELALETLSILRAGGINRIYLVPPIMRGGARDYTAAGWLLESARS